MYKDGADWLACSLLTLILSPLVDLAFLVCASVCDVHSRSVDKLDSIER
jgi:hypothetical protein